MSAARALLIGLTCGSFLAGCTTVDELYGSLRPQRLNRKEFELVRMINASRAKWNQQTVRPSGLLTAVARAHSAVMRRKGQGHHEDLGHRLRAAGYPYLVACENVFVAPYSLKLIHQGFLRSGPHARNMANPRVDEVGVGIIDDGRQLYVTQIFAKHSGYGRD